MSEHRPSTWPQWLAALVTIGGSAAWIASVASCHPTPPRAPGASARSPADTLLLAHLLGTWEWRLEADLPGLHRVERERWRFDADPSAPRDAPRAIGAYDRDVEIRSTDGTPFICDEDTMYRQRARYLVKAEAAGGVVTVTETAYQAEPSPCDRGFRKTGTYRAVTRGDRTTLSWDGGTQTLTRAADAPLPTAPPWVAGAPSWIGPWTWSARTLDDDGNLRDEREDWQIAVAADGLASATYVRTVTTTSIDDRPIACSGTRRWTFVDRYVLDGHVDDGRLTLTEVGVDAGTHPCLARMPRRSLDAFTAELDGGFADLEWRGKRRQVLHRPR